MEKKRKTGVVRMREKLLEYQSERKSTKKRRSESEAKFKQKVLKFLDELPYTYAVVITLPAVRGVPDIFACVNGRFVALELKRDLVEYHARSKRAKLQMHNIKEINYCRGVAFKVCPEKWTEKKKLLKRIAERGFHDQNLLERYSKSTLRQGFIKAGELAGLSPNPSLQGWEDGGEDPQVPDGDGPVAQLDSSEVRGEGREGESSST